MIVTSIESCSFRALGIWKVAEYNGVSVVLSDLPACHPATIQKQRFLDGRTHAIFRH